MRNTQLHEMILRLEQNKMQYQIIEGDLYVIDPQEGHIYMSSIE